MYRLIAKENMRIKIRDLREVDVENPEFKDEIRIEVKFSRLQKRDGGKISVLGLDEEEVSGLIIGEIKSMVPESNSLGVSIGGGMFHLYFDSDKTRVTIED